MIDGRIVKTGGADLADTIERDGYDRLREDALTALSTGASTSLRAGAVV